MAELTPHSANDATLKRTVAPTDVFSALTELEFDSFRARLEKELEAYTEIKAGKRKAKKSDVNGADAPAGEPAAKGDNEDVEMTDQPAKKMKREDNVEVVVGGDGDGDETQEEEIEEEEAEEDAEEDEEDEHEHEEKKVEDDIDRVEDLDGGSRPMDPDADETDDDDGPGSQLHNDLGLG